MFDGGSGDPQIAQIFAYGKCYYTVHPIWTTDGSKCIIQCKDVSWWCEWCYPKFWESDPQKMAFWVHAFDFQAWATKIQILI